MQMTLEGGKELERKLTSLERKVAKKIVRQAVRAGLRPTLAAAKDNARSNIGGKMGALIARHTVLRARKKQRRGSYSMAVRTKSESEGAPAEFLGETKEGARYYIPAALEFGHRTPFGPQGHKVGARPFMRPAADTTREQSIRLVSETLRAGILQAAKG
ncbi:MAG: hypothetical protein AMJ84_12265 [Acidithiobacillales bacterium SM23_46]|nr:MAG: hypothetical protein AMJ84_12265 [Acidithiobacillales bacterium SM23_46]KPL27962.1 MAG: hypothetical protein AMJ72_05860 [Acidithiobacillales bacterium SM1_46]